MLLDSYTHSIDLAGEITLAAEPTRNDIAIRINAYMGGEVNDKHYGPLVIDCGGISTPGTIPVQMDHRNEVTAMVGSGTPRTDGRKLWVEGALAPDSTGGKEVLAGHRGGSKYQASVGVTPLEIERVQPGQSVSANGRNFKAGDRGLTVIRKSRLNEVSVVAIGADRETTVSIAARYQPTGTEKMEHTTALADVTLTGTAEDRLEMLEKRFEAAQAKRVELAGVLDDEVTLARAVAEGWDVERARLHNLQTRLPKSPTAELSGPTHTAPRELDVMEAAVMLNAGSSGEDLLLSFDQRTVDAAHDGRWSGFGLQALGYRVLRLAGRSIAPGQFGNSTITELLRTSRDVQLAGQSLYSFTGIVGNVANKFALQGFNSVEQAWRKVCAIDSVKDFKEQSFYRLTGSTDYKIIGIGEAIPSGSLGEESFTNKADTYGLLLQVDRTTLINDDMGMIRQGARLKLGRGAGLALNKIIWAQWVAAANVGSGKFFHTTHTGRGPNYKAGADTVLSLESMQAADEMFQDQVDKDGVPLDVEPKFLLVPTSLHRQALDYYQSITVENLGTGSIKATTNNPYSGRFEVVCSKYLKTMPGGSATAWYLCADPNALGVGAMQVVFLNNRQVPYLETSEADFDTLGIKMRGYYDFAAKMQEKACAVKFKGAV